ncbi:hypothetical protein GCM10017708_30550 [Arthrobacter citreus]
MGYPQPGSACFQGGACHLLGPVAIGIGLDDGHYPGRADEVDKVAYVVPHCGQIDKCLAFGGGRSLLVIHLTIVSLTGGTR